MQIRKHIEEKHLRPTSKTDTSSPEGKAEAVALPTRDSREPTTRTYTYTCTYTIFFDIRERTQVNISHALMHN